MIVSKDGLTRFFKKSFLIYIYCLASWFDHSRDLLSMVNHFRERMPRPIFGIAHSMGAVQL